MSALSDNINAFRRLDLEIEAGEVDLEAMRWEQARLAWEAVQAGMTRAAYAREVDKGKSHVSVLVRVWDRWGVHEDGRPTFADAYSTINLGADDYTAGKIGRERQEPTRHDDRVEMARKLMADPEVVDDVMAGTDTAAALTEQAAHAKAAQRRKARAEAAGERDLSAALPLPANLARMLRLLREWRQAIADVEDDLVALEASDERAAFVDGLRDLADTANLAADRMDPTLPERTFADLPVIDVNPD